MVIVAQATLAAFVPALPSMGRELGGSAESADVTLVLYMAGYAVSMALAGTRAARFGLKRVQLCGLAVHGAGGAPTSVGWWPWPGAASTSIAQCRQGTVRPALKGPSP